MDYFQLFKDVLTVVVPPILGFFANEIRKSRLEALDRHTERMEQFKVIKQVLIQMMEDRLLQAHRYHIGRGYVEYRDLKVWLALYDAYKRLGADGAMVSCKEDIEKLPNYPPEVRNNGRED